LLRGELSALSEVDFDEGVQTYMEALAVKDLSKSFGGLQALTNVSFSVGEGERLVIIGPNGAGKTTLFNLISGELSPSSGRVYVFGKDVAWMPSHRRAHLGLARTFQITNLFHNLTLHENILLSVLGMSPERLCLHRSVGALKDTTAKARRFIRENGLQQSENVLVRNLSYGVQRQLEVIMALATDAKVLLLDEPTAGLSPAETGEITSLLLSLGTNMTLLIIEHDMDVAFRLADHLIVLHQGRVLAEGSPQRIATDPKVREIYLGEE
jgi:branched-chain amino acid transport system ATP-binding protein